jgi:voltage-gated potassium channel
MFREIFRTLRDLWKDAIGRSLVISAATVVGVGTVFYRLVEDWEWLDAFYFTMVTLTTVGYGDFHPTKPLSKIFTVALLIVGVSAILGFLNFVMSRTVKRRAGIPLQSPTASRDVLLVDGGHDAVVDGDPPGVEPHRKK